ncbi:MAG TPA: hypothetical protein VF358_01195 [Syntrophales bacterium]
MIQGLPEPVRAILDTLRDVTGRDVQFVRKPELKSLARIRMAGGASAAHVLFYRDEHDPRIHHVIANECGHLIRLFRAPVERRLVAVANERTQARYREEIREDIQRLSLIHGLDTLRTFIPLWYESVVFQLTRMPPDIMIERWLYEEYPDMRDIQLAALQEQHEKAVSVLSGNFRRMTPGKIYEVSQVMNYVFFRLAGELMGIRLIDAYEKSRYILEGEELAIWTAGHYSEDHEGDVSVIDTWARALQLSEWFEWRRFDEISQDPLH